jgi:hypothetical protein
MQIRRQSSTWYDVLSFLLLAAAFGLGSGVAFGAVALLLAGPAYGADSGEINEAAPHSVSIAAPPVTALGFP